MCFRRLAHIGLVGALASLLGACAPPTSSRQSDAASPQSQERVDEQQDGQFDAAKWWDSLEPAQQVASVLMLHYPGTDIAGITEFVETFEPGGMILMGNNIPSVESKLSEEIPVWAHSRELPLLVAIDQEGAPVSRLAEDPGLSAAELRDGDPQATEKSFRARGKHLRELGINVNFGVIADTTEDRDSFIWSRVLGSSPEQAAEHVAAAVTGEAGEVFSVLKHFPGHGTVSADSHVSIPNSRLSERRWMESAALPFEAGIEAGATMVMMGHLEFPKISATPASISPKWHRILRDDLGFRGVIVTDDMKMLRQSGDSDLEDPVRNAVEAINAGATLILDIGGDNGQSATEFAESLIAGLVQALEQGKLSESALRDAGLQLLELRATLRN